MARRPDPEDDLDGLDELGDDFDDDTHPPVVVDDDVPDDADGLDEPVATDSPVPEFVDDDAATPASSLDGLETEIHEAPGPRILSWRVDAFLPSLNLRLPAVLDPTVAHSTWTTRRLPEGIDTLSVAVADLLVGIELHIVNGDAEEFRLGRDFLADRVWIRVGNKP